MTLQQLKEQEISMYKEKVGMQVLDDMDKFEKETGEPAGEMDIEDMITERGVEFLKESYLRLEQAIREEEREELLVKLNSVYTRFEENKPPVTLSKADNEYNNGFYKGRLNAMEVVTVEVFNTTGEDLLTLK